jgi:hypothetical protein
MIIALFCYVILVAKILLLRDPIDRTYLVKTYLFIRIAGK